MENRRLEVKYIFNEDYNPDYATGAYGGLSPNGDIVMNFYQERSAIPNYTIVEFDENGRASSVKNKPEILPVIRYIVSGVTMNLDAAKQLNIWLNGLIEQAEKGIENAE